MDEKEETLEDEEPRKPRYKHVWAYWVNMAVYLALAVVWLWGLCAGWINMWWGFSVIWIGTELFCAAREIFWYFDDEELRNKEEG